MSLQCFGTAPGPANYRSSEMREKLAAEEEKKRKRAEKFGTAKPANGAESEGSVGLSTSWDLLV